jgi:uncharacterized protein (TIGR00299 family) protein
MRGKKVSSLYFDLGSGISGDMAVAALLSLDNDLAYLKSRLSLLDIDGWDIECTDELRNGIKGKSFSVFDRKRNQNPKNYRDIKKILSSSGFEDSEKQLALTIFEHIAVAESGVHGIEVDQVHFHEVGALDSIIDIASFSVLWASAISLGTGTIRSRHGILPVPSPATLAIVKGLPVVGTDFPSELTTPTGAAIVKSVVEKFGSLPGCVIKNVGTGFGKRREPGINALRLIEYDESDVSFHPSHPSAETVSVIEVTIDDSTPQEIAFLQETLFLQGALDVYVTPVYMKKNRPGFNVSVISRPQDMEGLSNTILTASSSFGLRYQLYNRKILERRIKKINTPYGTIAVKCGYLNGSLIKVVPEYEDCRKAGQKTKTPFREVWINVKIKAEEKLRGREVPGRS